MGVRIKLTPEEEKYIADLEEKAKEDTIEGQEARARLEVHEEIVEREVPRADQL